MRDREDVHLFFIVVTVRWRGEQEKNARGESVDIPAG